MSEESEDQPEFNPALAEDKPRKPWQFQPGQSGNPKGRPKLAHTDRHILDGIMDEIVPGSAAVFNRPKDLTNREVFWLTLVRRAMKGEMRAAEMVADRLLPKSTCIEIESHDGITIIDRSNLGLIDLPPDAHITGVVDQVFTGDDKPS